MRKIVYVNKSEYQQDAVDAAKDELFRRYTKDIWERDNIILKDLFGYSVTQDIEKSILKYYPSESESIFEYRNIIDKLISFKYSEASNVLIQIEKWDRSNSSYNLDWNVFGKDMISDERISLEYCSWKEWLTFRVDNEQLQQFGIENYIAHCIRTMTLISFDESEIIQNKNDIESRICTTDFEEDLMKEEIVDVNSFIADGIRKTRELKKEFEPNKSSQIRPWIRYFARSIDMFIWSNLVHYLWLFISRSTYMLLKTIFWGSLIDIITCFTWFFIEALLLSKTGYTLGKWLLDVKIRNQSNDKLTYVQVLKRTFYMWIYGYAVSIPFVGLITYILSYNRLKNKGITKWDEECHVIVSHKPVKKYKAYIAVILIVLLSILLVFLRIKKIII